MSFEIVTDSSSNLPVDYIKENNIPVVPLKYMLSDREYPVDVYATPAERRAYFGLMRNKIEVKTSLANYADFIEWFEPILQKGQDILYIGMAAGISGTFNNASIAAEELLETYPDRKIELVDAMNASLGEGIPVMQAIQMRSEGLDLETTAEKIREIIPHTRGCFMVDDIMYLHRTGRVNGVVAVAGKALGIRPLLKGDDTGHIVVFDKARGRKAALDALAKDFHEHVLPDSHQIVGVAHCDAEADAKYLIDKIKDNPAIDKIIFEWYEYVTGAHLGPGAVAMFYMADYR